jgi:hypothetical protein
MRIESPFLIGFDLIRRTPTPTITVSKDLEQRLTACRISNETFQDIVMRTAQFRPQPHQRIKDHANDKENRGQDAKMTASFASFTFRKRFLTDIDSKVQNIESHLNMNMIKGHRDTFEQK